MFNFPSLRKIDLNLNLMRHLDENNFEFTKELVDIDISNNQSLPFYHQFFTSSKLIRLSVANNSITSLPAQVFANQENLQYLDLSGNILTSYEIKPNFCWAFKSFGVGPESKPAGQTAKKSYSGI